MTRVGRWLVVVLVAASACGGAVDTLWGDPAADAGSRAADGGNLEGVADATLSERPELDGEATLLDARADAAVADDAADARPLEPCPEGAGSLDETFGDGGVAPIRWGPRLMVAHAVAVQPDGRVVVVGVDTVVSRLVVTRLLVDGGLDPTFGVHELVTPGFVDRVYPRYSARDVRIAPGGDIITTGHLYTSGRDVAVLRLGADAGRAAFGDSGVPGLAATSFDEPDASADAWGTSAALLPDGRIVVTGYREPAGPGYGEPASNTALPRKLVLLRHTPDGALDTSFRDAGRSVLDLDGPGEVPGGIVVSADGRIVVAVRKGNGRVVVLGFDTAGSLDAAFGVGGVRELSMLRGSRDVPTVSLSMDPAGRLVVAARTDDGASALVRLTSTGDIDPSFGDAGVAAVAFEDTKANAPTVLGIDTQGRSVVATTGRLVRVLPSGALDVAFGDAGRASSPAVTGLAIDGCRLYTAAGALGVVRHRL